MMGGQWNSLGTVWITLIGPFSQRGIGWIIGIGRIRSWASLTVISPRSSWSVTASSSASSGVAVARTRWGRGQKPGGIVGLMMLAVALVGAGLTVAIVRLSCATCKEGMKGNILSLLGASNKMHYSLHNAHFWSWKIVDRWKQEDFETHQRWKGNENTFEGVARIIYTLLLLHILHMVGIYHQIALVMLDTEW